MRTATVAFFEVAIFCRPEGAETGKPRRGEPRLRGRPWGTDPNENPAQP